MGRIKEARRIFRRRYNSVLEATSLARQCLPLHVVISLAALRRRFFHCLPTRFRTEDRREGCKDLPFQRSTVRPMIISVVQKCPIATTNARAPNHQYESERYGGAVDCRLATTTASTINGST